jgi:hypothetical protein
MVVGYSQSYRTYMTYSTYLRKMTWLNHTKGERTYRPFAFDFEIASSKGTQTHWSVPLALHRGQELGVRLGLLQPLEYDFHLFNRRQRIQNAPHHPDAIQIFLADQKFFLTCS